MKLFFRKNSGRRRNAGKKNQVKASFSRQREGGTDSRFTLYAPERSDVNNFHLRTAPNLSGRHDRKLYGKTGIMQDNFSLYPEVQPSTGI